MQLTPRFSIAMYLAVAVTLLHPALIAQGGGLPEAVEWTWEVRPPAPSPALPNVLLIGDSITRAYFPQGTKDLEGIANVYLMATSASIGDPRLPRQIADFVSLERIRFQVVHFNNGTTDGTTAKLNIAQPFHSSCTPSRTFPRIRGSSGRRQPLSKTIRAPGPVIPESKHETASRRASYVPAESSPTASMP